MKNVVKEILRNVAEHQRYGMTEEELDKRTEKVMTDYSYRKEVVELLREEQNYSVNFSLFANLLTEMEVKTIRTTYAQDTDMTFILEETESLNTLSTIRVIGWYFGEPNEADTKTYSYTITQ